MLINSTIFNNFTNFFKIYFASGLFLRRLYLLCVLWKKMGKQSLPNIALKVDVEWHSHSFSCLIERFKLVHAISFNVDITDCNRYGQFRSNDNGKVIIILSQTIEHIPMKAMMVEIGLVGLGPVDFKQTKHSLMVFSSSKYCLYTHRKADHCLLMALCLPTNVNDVESIPQV